MGLFGGQTKMDVRTESPVVVSEESQFDNTPGLPKPSSTVVAGGVTVTGTIKGEGVVQVEGVVEGEIVLTGAVVVSSSGLIRGPISAEVVRVAGRIEGSVTARDHLRLEQTGQVEGDVATASLVVEDGGRLNGRSSMIKPPESSLGDVRPVDDLQFGDSFKVGED